MIRLQQEDFDVGQELEKLTQGNTKIGGVAIFVGVVRQPAAGGPSAAIPPEHYPGMTGEKPRETAADGGPVAITLEHYPGMTEKKLEEIDAEAHRRWPLETSLIVHRYGRLKAGDRIVLVATTSAHREAAFESCRFLIDWLKTKAPFWKREETAAGARWVDADAKDDAAMARWIERKP